MSGSDAAATSRSSRPSRRRTATRCWATPRIGRTRRARPSSRRASGRVNLFFIVSGHARVATAHEGQRATLGPGDFFGELGLIEMHPRTATVVAEDEITCVLLPAWEFRGRAGGAPARWPSRWSTRSSRGSTAWPRTSTPAEHAPG